MRLHGRAAARADQLGVERVAVSITHEREYALADRLRRPDAPAGATSSRRTSTPSLDEREAALLRRMERLRALAAEAAALEPRGGRRGPTPREAGRDA